jgi:hypothetical protein
LEQQWPGLLRDRDKPVQLFGIGYVVPTPTLPLLLILQVHKTPLLVTAPVSTFLLRNNPYNCS